jgi:hypothetical protein
VVAVAAISPAYSALRQYHAGRANAAIKSWPKAGTIKLEVEDGLDTQWSDEEVCLNADDSD